MNMSCVIEFYTYENEVWYRTADGRATRLTEKEHEVIDMLLEKIEQFYPGAYAALSKEYERLQCNLSLFRFRVVQRFAKCNFGVIDNIDDVDKFGRLNLESVPVHCVANAATRALSAAQFSTRTSAKQRCVC